MFITDKKALVDFSTPYRLWQGIPGIEVTDKGRIFSTFYSGGTKEEVNNFVALLLLSSYKQADRGAYLRQFKCRALRWRRCAGA